MPPATKLLSVENDGEALALRFRGADNREFDIVLDPDALASAFGMLITAASRMPASAAKAEVPSIAAPKQVQLSVVSGHASPAALLLTCGPVSMAVALPRSVMAALRDHLSAFLSQPPSQAS
jgi:hypothetical protein